MHAPHELQGRTTPQSEDTEISFVAMALMDPKRAFQAAAVIALTKEDFYWPGASTVYGILQEFWHANEPIDAGLLAHVLRDRQLLNTTGGRIRGQSTTGSPFITELATLMPTVEVAEAYAEIIKHKANRRCAIGKIAGTLEDAYDTTIEDAEFLSSAESALLDIVKLRAGHRINSRTMRELVARSVQRIQEALESDGTIDMPTGITELDYVTMGFRAPEVTVIAGKPSDGKSALSFNIAEYLSIYRHKKVGIISLEMSDDQCSDRLLASSAWVNVRKIKQDRTITDSEREKIHTAALRLADAPIYIRDDGELTMAEIDATFASWKTQHGLDMGIIDHAQLAKGGGRHDGRTEEVESISRRLKPMAKRLGIPLIVLSQVTEDKNGDYATKNSKALQEDADNLWSISHKYVDGAAHSTIHISKQRDGERNVTIPVTYIPHLMRFASKARETDEQPELLNGLPPKKRRK